MLLALRTSTALFAFCILCGVSSKIKADTITFGTSGTRSVFTQPFGGTYAGQYQQIYSSSQFSNPVTISRLEFASALTGGTVNATYNLTISLGTSATSPSAPNPNFAANRGTDITTVFSGVRVDTLTGAGGAGGFDLDFAITPFSFDPSRGDLLLEIFINSANVLSAPIGFAGRSSTSDFGSVITTGARPNEGLTTRITFDQAAPVPEPATMLLLGIGLAGVATRVRWRR